MDDVRRHQILTLTDDRLIDWNFFLVLFIHSFGVEIRLERTVIDKLYVLSDSVPTSIFGRRGLGTAVITSLHRSLYLTVVELLMGVHSSQTQTHKHDLFDLSVDFPRRLQ